MRAIQLIAIGLLSLCIGIPCQAATFEKVSSSFSVVRDVHLNCSGADPGDRDWYFSETVDDAADGYSSWGHTPLLKKGTAYLVDLNNNETASTGMYFDDPNGGGEGGHAVPLDAAYNRVNLSVLQRPVLTFWQPGFGYTYSVDMDVATNAIAYYKIQPSDGESVGDEVTLAIDGWREHTENLTGGPGGVISAGQVTNAASIPGFVNHSGSGIWHEIDGMKYYTVHVGDIIGMKASATSSMNASGPIPSWPIKYVACGLLAHSMINVFIIPKPLTGDIDGNRSLNMGDAILALQVVSGLNPYDILAGYPDAGVDVNGDGKIGLAEAIFIMQKLSETR